VVGAAGHFLAGHVLRTADFENRFYQRRIANRRRIRIQPFHLQGDFAAPANCLRRFFNFFSMPHGEP